jgi:hypothetical protein
MRRMWLDPQRLPGSSRSTFPLFSVRVRRARQRTHLGSPGHPHPAADGQRIGVRERRSPSCGSWARRNVPVLNSRNRTAALTARYRPFRDAIGQLQPVACSKRASVSGRSLACGRLDTYLSHFINLAKRNQAAIASCLEAAAKAKKEQY